MLYHVVLVAVGVSRDFRQALTHSETQPHFAVHPEGRQVFGTNVIGFAVLVAMTVTPERSRLRRLLLKLLRENPGLREVVAGLGQSIDPLPVCYRSTFITDDQLAIAEDWLAVGGDMRVGLRKAEDYVRGDRRQPGAKRQE